MESLSWSLSWCPPRPTAPTTLPWPPCRTRCRRKSPGAALNSPESAKMTAIAPLITTPTPRSDPSLKHMPVWSLNHRLYITGCISFFLFFSPSVTHVCHIFFFSFFWNVFFFVSRNVMSLRTLASTTFFKLAGTLQNLYIHRPLSQNWLDLSFANINVLEYNPPPNSCLL